MHQEAGNRARYLPNKTFGWRLLPPFVWTEAPSIVAPDAAQHGDENDEAEDEDDAEVASAVGRRRYGPQLRDHGGSVILA